MFHQLGNKEAESPLLCSPCLCHAGPISIFNLLRWGCVLPSPHDPGAIWALGHLRTSIVGPSVPAVTIVVASPIVRISLAASCVLTFQQLRAKPLWFPRIHPPSIYSRTQQPCLLTGSWKQNPLEQGPRRCSAWRKVSCSSIGAAAVLLIPPGHRHPQQRRGWFIASEGSTKRGRWAVFPIGCSVLLSQR